MGLMVRQISLVNVAVKCCPPFESVDKVDPLVLSCSLVNDSISGESLRDDGTEVGEIRRLSRSLYRFAKIAVRTLAGFVSIPTWRRSTQICCHTAEFREANCNFPPWSITRFVLCVSTAFV